MPKMKNKEHLFRSDNMYTQFERIIPKNISRTILKKTDEVKDSTLREEIFANLT